MYFKQTRLKTNLSSSPNILFFLRIVPFSPPPRLKTLTLVDESSVLLPQRTDGQVLLVLQLQYL